jgi:hypothetical protein
MAELGKEGHARRCLDTAKSYFEESEALAASSRSDTAGATLRSAASIR